MTTDDTTSATVAVVRRTWTSAATASCSLVCLGVLVTVPWWASEARQRDLIELFTLLALAQMWNLLAGYAGLVSIGQQAFIGIGAYGLLLLGDRADIHPFAAVALAGLAAAAISLPVAALVFRLRGGYFAIGTWVIAEVFALLTLNGSDFGVDVGGGNGATILSAARLERTFRSHGTYWWALGLGAGSVLAVYAILRSRIGLALTAIRDDETAARSLGVNVLRTKVLVWTVAALGCGLVGAVIHLNLVRVQPDGRLRRAVERVHDLHRRDRRHRHDRGADHRHDRLLHAAAEALAVRCLVPHHPGLRGGARGDLAARRRLGDTHQQIRRPALPCPASHPGGAGRADAA